MTKMQTESDVLNREWEQLRKTIRKLYRKHGPEAEPAVQQIRKRIDQIIDQLEECTGVKVRYTEEEILAEIEERTRRVENAIAEAKWEEKHKSDPCRESKFKASSAPGQTTLDFLDGE